VSYERLWAQLLAGKQRLTWPLASAAGGE